jgi:hypothetical protein
LRPKAAGEHFETYLPLAGFLKKVKVPGFVIQGQKAGVERLRVHHLHPGVVEHAVAVTEVIGLCGSFGLEGMIRAELETAHFVGIHKERWGSVKGWRHEFSQIVDIKLARILTEAEKKGQRVSFDT